MLYSSSLVTQEPFLWFSTLRDNLDLEHVCADSEIWDALELVGMKDLISALPEKLDTVLEAGGSFSRGEVPLTHVHSPCLVPENASF